ncbi:MAG: metal transporter [Gemmatimonadaceae bacterium]|nr:metal transporter [Gemmatimonadaceae bacterium]
MNLRLRTIAAVLIPLVLLAAVIVLFVRTNGAGLNVAPAAPIETVQFGRTILRPGEIELHLRNTSPQPITLAQVNINDAIWPYSVTPSPAIPRLGSAVITMAYPWVQGEAYEISLLSSSSIAFATSIPVAAVTTRVSSGTLLSFTLIGLYVGVIPIILGMLWLPVLKQMGAGAMLFLMSATVGLLLFLGIDATAEALELTGRLSDTFQGVGIIGIGIVGTWLLLDAIGRQQRTAERSEAGRRLSLATVIAIGIGLHNFGEGLAIGAAYAIGAAALGTFLVVGFIIQNITEGLGIVVPIAKDSPKLPALAKLGLIGGAPAIVGAWLGGLVHSPPLSILFLSIGAGAVFQVAYEIGRNLVWKRAGAALQERPLFAFGGVLAGMLVLYVTGLAIK